MIAGAYWRVLIQSLKQDVKFNPPATAAELDQAQRRLGLKFPIDLQNVLLESNGIEDWFLAAEEIVSTNLKYRSNPEYREIYMPFDGLLFFLSDGTGSYYAFPVCGGKCDAVPTVFYWLHEDDSRTVVGQTMKAVLDRYLCNS